jgi:hypothetical protein
MDLLLHLVREQEVEIHEIEINTVVQGYLDYLKAMKELDIELAGDFLVMAATLMSIKSRSLLPREEIDLEKELDPRDELIQRLIEYRRFHDAAANLGGLHDLRTRCFARGSAGIEADDREAMVLDLGDLTAWDLLAGSRGSCATHPAARTTSPWTGSRCGSTSTSSEADPRSAEVSLRLAAQPEPERSRESWSAPSARARARELGLVTVDQPDARGDLLCACPEHETDPGGPGGLLSDDERELGAGGDRSAAAGALLDRLAAPAVDPAGRAILPVFRRPAVPKLPHPR